MNELVTSFVVSGWPAACFANYSAMKKDEILVSETSVDFYQTARRHILEDSTLNTDELAERGVLQNIEKEETNWKKELRRK